MRSNFSAPSQPVQCGEKSCCCSCFPLSFICCQTSKRDLFYTGSQAFQPLPVLLHCGTAAAPGDSKLRCFTHQPGSKHLCKTPEVFPSHSVDLQSSVSLRFSNSITEQNQGIVSSHSTHGKGEMSEQAVYESF